MRHQTMTNNIKSQLISCSLCELTIILFPSLSVCCNRFFLQFQYRPHYFSNRSDSISVNKRIQSWVHAEQTGRNQVKKISFLGNTKPLLQDVSHSRCPTQDKWSDDQTVRDCQLRFVRIKSFSWYSWAYTTFVRIVKRGQLFALKVKRRSTIVQKEKSTWTYLNDNFQKYRDVNENYQNPNYENEDCVFIRSLLAIDVSGSAWFIVCGIRFVISHKFPASDDEWQDPREQN